jgi:putative peptidoglycan lipid II flippase
LKKNTGSLFLIRLIKLLVGVFSLSLTAKYFGVSLEKDVWLLAVSGILFLDMAFWGPINETFRSKFIFLKSELNADEALNATKSLLFFSLIISLGLVCFIFIFPTLLANLIAPTYSGIQCEKLVSMIMIAAPILLITQLSAIGTSILNAYESFFIPELTGFITAIINLVILYLLAPSIGIYSLVLSYYIGAIILIILLLIQINKMRIPVLSGYTNLSFKGFKTFFLFALPFYLPYSFGQISSILEKTLVSTIGFGKVSALDYSRKFTDIFISVLTSVLFTMLLPVLTSKFVEKKPREFADNFKQVFQVGILLLSFILPVFTAASSDIVKIFFDKGKIDHIVLLEISKLTVLYSWSAFGVFLYLIFGIASLSSGQAKKFAFFGMLTQIFSIVINLSLVNIVGIYIFPISLLLTHLASGLILSNRFPYKSHLLIRMFLKYVFILLLTTITVYFGSRLFERVENPFVKILNTTLLTSLSLFVLIFVFDLDEKKVISLYYNKIKKRCLNF